MSITDELGSDFMAKMRALWAETGREETEDAPFFQQPTEAELAGLRGLIGENAGRVLEFYREYQPYDAPMLPCYLNLLSIATLLEENKNFAPGAYVSRHGVFVFGTTVGGDAVCIDTDSAVGGDPPVLLVDHTFCSEDASGNVCISHIPERVIKQLDAQGASYALPFDHASIALCAAKLNDSFVDFIRKLADNYYEDIEEFLED